MPLKQSIPLPVVVRRVCVAILLTLLSGGVRLGSAAALAFQPVLPCTSRPAVAPQTPSCAR